MKQEAVTPEADVSEAKRSVEAAEQTLIKITGMPVLSGFKQELEAAIKQVTTATGPPKSNWKTVKNLVRVTELTNKVLCLVDASEQP